MGMERDEGQIAVWRLVMVVGTLMKQFLEIYDTPAYYKVNFGINEDFTLASGKLAVSYNNMQDEGDAVEQQMDDTVVPSTYSCHKDG